MPDATATSGPIRLGYHGSIRVARRIIRAAGMAETGFRLRQYDIADPFRALRSDELDVMVVKFALREADLEHSAVLAHDARAALVGENHPLARRASVSVEELAPFDSFSRPERMPAYVWDEVVPPRTPGGQTVNRAHRLTTVEEMMTLVTASRAVHMTLESLCDVAAPGVRIVPIHDLPPAPVFLAWRREAGCVGRIREFARRASRRRETA
jgi:DNA-binding transcriptional LysR family regulator